VPLLIHIDPTFLVTLGYTCRYCPDCDLLVAHQDDIEHMLASMFAERDPSIIGNDYLVMGTVERAAWRAGMKTPGSMEELLNNLHDFKQVLQFEYRPAGWYPDEERGARSEKRAARRGEQSRDLLDGRQGRRDQHWWKDLVRRWDARHPSNQGGTCSGSVRADESGIIRGRTRRDSLAS